MKIIIIFLSIVCIFFSKGVEDKTLSLEEQFPEHFYWGFEKTIFNDQERRNVFLKKIFSESKIKEIDQSHLCLFKNEIIDQNATKKVFDVSRLNRFLDIKCKTPDVDMPYFKHSHWQSIMYRSNDSKLLCRSRNDCAVLLEENNQKIVFGWLNHGVEVFKKNKEFEYVKTNEKYNLDPYLEKEGFKNINDYVLSSPNIGGLGNQLFSYLSGLVYAKRNNKILFRVESSYFDNFLDSPIAPTTDESLLKYKRAPEFVKRSLNLNKCYFSHELPSSASCYETGWYLQSWKNLAGYEDYIRDNVVFKNEVSEKNKEIMDKMKSQNSVALHVRRGDYVPSEYILLTQNYYTQAIEYIKRNVKDPVFYIFSNDLKWSKENIKIDAPHVYVDWTRKDYEDLQLMSNCKHFINANSSFSWWGSFLSRNKNKIIIGPDKHTSWDVDWIKNLLAPNFVVIEVEKHYWSKQKNQFVTE